MGTHLHQPARTYALLVPLCGHRCSGRLQLHCNGPGRAPQLSYRQRPAPAQPQSASGASRHGCLAAPAWRSSSVALPLCVPRPCNLHRRRRPAPACRAAGAAAAPAGPGGGGGQAGGGAHAHWLRNPAAAWRQWWSLGPPGPSQQAAGHTQGLWPLVVQLWRAVGIPKALLATAFLFLVLAALAELTIPHFTSAAIFAATKAGDAGAFQTNVRWLTAASLGYGLFAGIRGYCFSLLSIHLIQRLRAQVFSALVRQEAAFFDAEEVGALTSRLAADCQGVVRAISTNINVALRNALQCIGGAVYLWMLAPRLAVATALVSTLLWAVALRYGAFTRKTQAAYQDALADTNQVAEEVFTLSHLVRTFGTEAQEAARYTRALGRLRHIGIRSAAAYLLYLTSNASLYNLTKVVTLAVGGGMALAGAITPQQLTTFVLYVEFVTSASLSVCDQWGGLMEAAGSSERVLAYLARAPAPQLAPGATLPAFSGRVELRGVHFRYANRPEAAALSDISLTFQPGRLVALVGLSGSGKSTLVQLIARLYDPTQGQVLVDGVDLRTIDAAWYRRQIGVVLQDSRLFSTDIASNIAYGCDDVSQADIEEAARLANAHGFISQLPNGYQEKVTDRLLSGGQRQRIAIARALVRKPALLLLDEATSALDAESEAAVQGALDRAMRLPGRTILVIAHRLSTVRNADVTVVLNQGRVAQVGTHDELLARGGIYAELVARQGGAVPAAAGDMAPHAEAQEAGASQSVDQSREEEDGLPAPHEAWLKQPAA